MDQKEEQIEDANEVVADLAESIVKIADAAEKLLSTGLTQKALILLLQDKIGITNIRKTDIDNVLWALPKLKDYIKKV